MVSGDQCDQKEPKKSTIIPIKGVEPDGEDETDDDDLFGLHVHHLISSLLLKPALLFSQVNGERYVLISS